MFLSHSLDWSYLEKKCNLSYIGESSKCLENIVKELNGHVTSVIYKRSVLNNHPWANILHFKIIDQDSKQVAREARDATCIRINNSALSHNTGKMYIPEIFNHLLGVDESTNESNQDVDSDLPQGHTHLTILTNRFSRTVHLAN